VSGLRTSLRRDRVTGGHVQQDCAEAAGESTRASRSLCSSGRPGLAHALARRIGQVAYARDCHSLGSGAFAPLPAHEASSCAISDGSIDLRECAQLGARLGRCSASSPGRSTVAALSPVDSDRQSPSASSWWGAGQSCSKGPSSAPPGCRAPGRTEHQANNACSVRSWSGEYRTSLLIRLAPEPVGRAQFSPSARSG